MTSLICDIDFQMLFRILSMHSSESEILKSALPWGKLGGWDFRMALSFFSDFIYNIELRFFLPEREPPFHPVWTKFKSLLQGVIKGQKSFPNSSTDIDVSLGIQRIWKCRTQFRCSYFETWLYSKKGPSSIARSRCWSWYSIGVRIFWKIVCKNIENKILQSKIEDRNNLMDTCKLLHPKIIYCTGKALQTFWQSFSH